MEYIKYWDRIAKDIHHMSPKKDIVVLPQSTVISKYFVRLWDNFFKN